MFPRARKLLSAAELNALGAQMASRKSELLAMGTGRIAKAATKVVNAISPKEDDDDATPEVPAAVRNRSANGRGTGARASR